MRVLKITGRKDLVWIYGQAISKTYLSYKKITSNNINYKFSNLIRIYFPPDQFCPLKCCLLPDKNVASERTFKVGISISIMHSK